MQPPKPLCVTVHGQKLDSAHTVGAQEARPGNAVPHAGLMRLHIAVQPSDLLPSLVGSLLPVCWQSLRGTVRSPTCLPTHAREARLPDIALKLDHIYPRPVIVFQNGPGLQQRYAYHHALLAYVELLRSICAPGHSRPCDTPPPPSRQAQPP